MEDKKTLKLIERLINEETAKMLGVKKTDNPEGAAYVSVNKNGTFEKKTKAPVNAVKDLENIGDAIDAKINKFDKEGGSDNKIAAAVEVKATGSSKKGDSVEGMKNADFTSKKQNPTVSKDNDPTQEGGKPGGKTNEPKMNAEDKAGPQKTSEVTKTMVTAGSDMKDGFSKGQKTAVSHDKAQNEKEKIKKIADAIQLPEGFKSKKELEKFIEEQAIKALKLL